MSFVCCTYKDQEDDDFEVFWSSLPTPSRKTRRNKFSWRRNKEDNKNPYSNRGLDKYEALLADLDDMKRKIFTQKGSQYISLVRFVYSNSNHIKPIIVWLKDPRRHHKLGHNKQNSIKHNRSSSLPSLRIPTMDRRHNQEQLHGDINITNRTKLESKEVHHAKPSSDKISKKIRVYEWEWKLNLRRKLKEWWTPSYNLPLFMILVILFLTLFGRSLAIICTSIAWYVFPTIDGTLEKTTPATKKMIKNQHHSRKPSENKVISSPKPFLSGPISVKEDKKMEKLMSF